MEQHISESIDLGTWIGRGQAFGVIANGCTAAQAECLKQISESGTYKQTGLTWDEFCQQYIGLTRQRVDALIGNLEEFGKTFFELSNIVRISPEAYRKVAKQIQGHSLQIGAELVPIVPENAARIRNAVNHLRSEVKDARHDARVANGDTTILMMRLESCFHRMYDLATDPRLTKSENEALTQMIEWYNCQAERITRALEDFHRLT